LDSLEKQAFNHQERLAGLRTEQGCWIHWKNKRFITLPQPLPQGRGVIQRSQWKARGTGTGGQAASGAPISTDGQVLNLLEKVKG